MLLEQQVSGVIFAGGLYAQAAADHEHYRRMRDRGLPAVLVNAAYEDPGFPRGCADDPHAGDQAAGPLTALGHEPGTSPCTAHASPTSSSRRAKTTRRSPSSSRP